MGANASNPRLRRRAFTTHPSATYTRNRSATVAHNLPLMTEYDVKKMWEQWQKGAEDSASQASASPPVSIRKKNSDAASEDSGLGAEQFEQQQRKTKRRTILKKILMRRKKTASFAESRMRSKSLGEL
ncbi:unnamed protein product [Caenorhabditis angaria]|uniref:Uncharacterized protein n=1 Tax=Caenorhabditis angaria TaxID=860376 RepID=A0A9P1ISH3_9PELO|nr:unnamed protein product [Caenorhabditis angaria]